MSRFIRFSLLFISFFVAITTFATDCAASGTAAKIDQTALFKPNSLVYFPQPPTNDFSFVNKTFPEELNVHNPTFKAKSNYTRNKKKIKRWLPNFSGVKPPVKEIDLLPFNIFSTTNYSKPHFLSHLHYFLFRLTPF